MGRLDNKYYGEKIAEVKSNAIITVKYKHKIKRTGLIKSLVLGGIILAFIINLSMLIKTLVLEVLKWKEKKYWIVHYLLSFA